MTHDEEPRLLVLRSMAAIHRYLDGYPRALPQAPDAAWMSLPEWLAEGDDCDEDHFHRALSLGYPALRVPEDEDRGATGTISPELARRLRAVPTQRCGGWRLREPPAGRQNATHPGQLAMPPTV